MARITVAVYIAETTDHQTIERWRDSIGTDPAHTAELKLMRLWVEWEKTVAGGAHGMDASALPEEELLTRFHEWCIETGDDDRDAFVAFCKTKGVEFL